MRKLNSLIYGVILLTYIAAYIILMARNVPAVDKYGIVKYRSAFRFGNIAGRVRKGGPEAVEVSVLNYIFIPLDVVFYAISKTNSYNHIHNNSVDPLH
jgi:hypothetical protein